MKLSTGDIKRDYEIMDIVCAVTSTQGNFDYISTINLLGQTATQMGADAVLFIRINERTAVGKGCFGNTHMVGEVRAYGTAVQFK